MKTYFFDGEPVFTSVPLMSVFVYNQMIFRKNSYHYHVTFFRSFEPKHLIVKYVPTELLRIIIKVELGFKIYFCSQIWQRSASPLSPAIFQKRVLVVDEVSCLNVRKESDTLGWSKKAEGYPWQARSLQIKQAQRFVECLLSDICYENLKRGRTMAGWFAWKVENFFSLCHSRRYPLHEFLFCETSVTDYLCVTRCSVIYIIHANYSKGLSGRETKRIHTKLVTICDKNEQQQDAKNNAELQTKWTKTTWKDFEKTVRRGRNRSIKA